MEIGWNVLWFIIAVSLLVTVHEFGHFWVARRLGFKVLRFSVGFGKPLCKRVGRAPDHTEYVIAALPLGGYVRMLDERDGAVRPEDLPRAFGSKPPWQRILVMLAGPAANILFAILVLLGHVLVQRHHGRQARWSARSLRIRRRPRPGLRSGDEIRQPSTASLSTRPGRRGARIVRRVSDDGQCRIDVRGSDGQRAQRCTLSVAGSRAAPQARRSPATLSRGLGFDFWYAAACPAIARRGHERRTCRRSRVSSPAIHRRGRRRRRSHDYIEFVELHARAPGSGDRVHRAPWRQRNQHRPSA